MMDSEGAALNQLAEDLRQIALAEAVKRGLDSRIAAAACGFAGTKILAAMAQGDGVMAMELAHIFASSGMRAMADIISGGETEHQVVQ